METQISQTPKYEIGRILKNKVGYFIVVGREQLGNGIWVYKVIPLADHVIFTEQEVDQLH